MRAVDQVIAATSMRDGPSISWLVGEPCFAPPPQLLDALARAATSPVHGYPPHNGLAELREVLAAYHGIRGQQMSSDQITVTSGAKAGLMAVLSTMLEPGDELIHPQPGYPAYRAMATRLGAKPIPVPERGGGFEGWAAAVADRIGPRTRAVVIASPSNPTGATLDASEARALVELCRDRGLILICDEAYVDFAFAEDREATPADFDPDRTTVLQVRSVSKSWALCGWRVGWVAAEGELAEAVARSHAALINPASGPAQQALCSLPEVSPDFIGDARTKVEARISELCSTLESVGASITKPEGGFYLWLDISAYLESSDASTSLEWCVEKARRSGVALWPGEDFGSAHHVRIAVTSPSDEEWSAWLESLMKVFAGE